MSVVDQYRKQRDDWKAFSLRMNTLLSDLLEFSSIDYHVIESRAKTVDSLSEKVTRAGKAYESLSSVPDLVGIRIVLFDHKGVAEAEALINKEFDVDPSESSNKSEELAPDQFGYLSVHKVVRLSTERSKITEWSRFSEKHAEIQIRTVLQHAWASVSHKLQYKREGEIPAQLRRRLMRLAGLFELADDEFLALRRQDSVIREEIQSDVASREKDIPLDLVSIIAFIQNNETVRLIGDEAAKHNRITSDIDAEEFGDQLLYVADKIGCKTITELEDKLNYVLPYAERFFNELNYEMLGTTSHFAAVLLMAVFNEKFTKHEHFPFEAKAYGDAITAAGRRILL